MTPISKAALGTRTRVLAFRSCNHKHSHFCALEIRTLKSIASKLFPPIITSRTPKLLLLLSSPHQVAPITAMHDGVTSI